MPNPAKTILGFDFGSKRIGVAVGQTITQSATPLKTLNANQGEPNWDEIKTIIQQWQVSELVVGLPLNMNGSEQAITHAARAFAKQLAERFKLPVHEIDERLSTVEAREQVFAAGGFKALKKKQIDGVAAVLILEQWMREQC